MSGTIFSLLLLATATQLLWVKLTVGAGTLALLIVLISKVRALTTMNMDLRRKVSEQSELLEYSVEREKKAREMVAQNNLLKSVLLGKINHEVRTPLNGVLGMTSLLGETSLTDEQREYCDTIIESGNYLLKAVNEILLDDILQYSKVDSSKMELQQKQFDITNCIEDAFDVFATKAESNKVELIYDINEDVPSVVIGDALRLKQVMVNLVENALMFTKEGHILVSVGSRKLEDSKIELMIGVSDTGRGISPDRLSVLSSELANSSGDRSVMKVGLEICKKLVELMEGNISVVSTEGKGTIVSFSVKVLAVRNADVKASADEAVMKDRSVLLIQRHSLSRVMFEKQLSSWGLKLTVAVPDEALPTLETNNRIDLIIADGEHVDMQLLRSLKAKQPNVPVIVLAASKDEKQKYDGDVVVGRVTKPIRKHILQNEIANCFVDHKRNPAASSVNKLTVDFAVGHPLRILVAEDNPTNQKLILKVLSKLGYQAEMVKTGKEVLEVVSHKSFDLILMDVEMPEMDGIEACRMIRICLSSQPVIVAMTANTLQGDREKCLEAGMDNYIAKPIVLEELVHVLEKSYCQVTERKFS